MKKIYSLMLALFATLCVGTAYAEDPVRVILNVDNPNAISVCIGDPDETPLTITSGNNEIEIPYNDNWGAYELLYVLTKTGYGISNIAASSANAPEFEAYAGVYSLDPVLWDGSSADGVTYTITTYDMSAMRTDSVLVRIDDITKASFGRGNESVVLNEGEWTTIKYIPADEEGESVDLPLVVFPEENLYKVLHNGTTVSMNMMGRYVIFEPNNGDSIDIICNAPADATAPVIFEWAEGAIKEALDSVLVDGTKVEYKDTIEVKWNSIISLYFNIDTYLVKVNNTRLRSSEDSYSVLDTLVLEISTELYKDINFTIIAHNPSCFTVQKSLDLKYFTLQEGNNDVKVTTKDNTIYISKAADCILDSVYVNGKRDYYPSAVQCKEGDTIEIWAQPIVRDLTFMLYVDNVKGYSGYTVRTILNNYFGNSSSSPLLTSGYNVCEFGAVDNPVTMKFTKDPSGKPVYYLNDAVLTAENFDMFSNLKLTLADGDVVKVFADTAKVYTVTLNKGEKAVVKGVTKDRIWALNADTTSFTVLQGTEVTLTVPTNMVLKGGDDELTGENGVYTITVNSDTTINITATDATNCAEANAAAKGTHAVLGEFVVAYVNGKYTYIQDETGSALIYKYDLGLKAGDVVTGFEGNVDIFNNLPELVPSVELADMTVTAGEAPAPAVHTTTLTTADVNKYIKLEGVTAVGTFTSDKMTTITGEWNGEPLNMYNKFKIAQEFTEGVTYDVVCAVSVYYETLQVYFISAEALSTNVENAVIGNKAEKFVRDGQLIIRMNGVEYNVLGAKLQ